MSSVSPPLVDLEKPWGLETAFHGLSSLSLPCILDSGNEVGRTTGEIQIPPQEAQNLD